MSFPSRTHAIRGIAAIGLTQTVCFCAWPPIHQENWPCAHEKFAGVARPGILRC